ncbi:IgGFc-binding protein-like [Eriocheir sinensis]|uniref:IgGFc-binding protein-like n=1 Tax=Eriocheir sinensis TaxID=95602 RepID=UPI0021C6F023|nr:IgGFc-binding protein-like [Eriocheir sinensis]
MQCGMKMLWVLAALVVLAECGQNYPQKSCMFGKATVADGEVAMSVPEKCMSLVCQAGTVVEKMTGEINDTGCCLDGDNMMYPPSFRAPHCIPVTCTNGSWVPENFIDPCCGHCEIYGYSHFTTLDRYRYDWHGFCNYTLVSLAATDRAPSAAVFAEMKRVGPCATVFDSVTFHNDPHTIINLTRDANNKVSEQIDINGESMTVPRTGAHVVYSSAGRHNVLAFWQKDCLVLLGHTLITLRYCPFHMDIWIPRELSGDVDGICGHFNYNATDDFTAATGQILPLEPFPVNFPDMHWRAPDQRIAPCNDPMITTSMCNGTTGDKCLLSGEALQDFQRACMDSLTRLFPQQPRVVDYYLAPCVADLCLASQRDVNFTVSLSAFIVEVLKMYRNITVQHYEDHRVTPVLMDPSMCFATDDITTTSIPVVTDDDDTTTKMPTKVPIKGSRPHHDHDLVR